MFRDTLDRAGPVSGFDRDMDMVAFDYIILILLLASTGIGWFRGFFREALSLTTWIIALWVAWKFPHAFDSILGGVLSDPVIKLWVGRFLTFIAIVLIGGLINAVVAMIIKSTGLSSSDRSLGMLFGFGRGFLLIGLLIILAEQLDLSSESWWEDSLLVPYTQPVARLMREILDSGATYLESVELAPDIDS